jgi:small subunit ribosomal protein S3Ae
VDGLFNLVTKDGYKLRISVSALTLSRIKTSQEKIIRDMMEETIKDKAANLTLDQFVQEMVLGKIASDIYNQAKLVAPLRHVGIRKSKLVAAPNEPTKKVVAAEAEPEPEAPVEAEA